MSRHLPLHRLAWGLVVAFVASTVNAADRVALIIGNNAYQHAPALTNPASDAAAVADALERSGYTVIRVKDGGVEAMLRGLEKFCEIGRGAEGAVFFYAGHGMEVEGKNYLLPVDARLEERVHLRTQAVGLDAVLEEMSAVGMGLKVIVLDCCRDNPLPSRSWLRGRSAGGGLAAVAEKDLKEGTMLVYSGAPGRTVPDGESSHSPFTESFLAQIGKGTATALAVFTAVATDLGKKTNGAQEPWIRFDGSGRSLAAFSSYVLTRGAVDSGLIVSASSTAPPLMKQSPSLPITDTPPSPAMPADLPSSGYFSLDEVFLGSAYAGYSKYSRGLILKKAQEKLKAVGLYGSSPDGLMGKGSEKALLEWQSGHQLKRTGRLESETLVTLGLAGIEQSEPPAPPPAATAESSAPMGSKYVNGTGQNRDGNNQDKLKPDTTWTAEKRKAIVGTWSGTYTTRGGILVTSMTMVFNTDGSSKSDYRSHWTDWHGGESHGLGTARWELNGDGSYSLQPLTETKSNNGGASLGGTQFKIRNGRLYCPAVPGFVVEKQ